MSNGMIEHVRFHNTLLGIIIRASYRQKGISFFTPPDFSQQLGYMSRPKGYTIVPHTHRHVERKVVLTQEVLFVRSGRVRVDFYTEEGSYLESREVQEGDVILLASGGHGFEMLEDAELIEVKQGPYNGEMDKVRFALPSQEVGNSQV